MPRTTNKKSKRESQIKRRLASKLGDAESNLVMNDYMSKKTDSGGRGLLPKLNLSHSQPELFDRKAPIKDSAKEEQNKRASFLTQNQQLNKHLSEKDPLVTIPD